MGPLIMSCLIYVCIYEVDMECSFFLSWDNFLWCQIEIAGDMMFNSSLLTIIEVGSMGVGGKKQDGLLDQ